MRKMIAAAAMLLAVPSLHAAEELVFGDVNFFIKKSQFNLIADASQTTEKASTKNSTTLMKRGYTVSSQFGYGVTDRLNFYVGIDYRFDDGVQDLTTKPKPRTYSMNGLSNPSLAANYRL